MELTLPLTFLLIGIGLLLGIASGITGISAVNLVVPILYTVFALAILVSLGTSLLIDVISAGMVTYLYYRHKNVDFKIGLLMGVVGFGFAILGAFIAFRIAFISEKFLANAFGYFQIIIGVTFIIRGIRKSEIPETGELEKSRFTIFMEKFSDKYKKLILIIASVIMGLFGGLFGAGGGFLITFILIFAFAFESHKAVGTACLVMLLIASGASIFYAATLSINLVFGGILGVCCIVGALLGSKFAHILSEKHLTITLGIFILIFAIIMILTKT